MKRKLKNNTIADIEPAVYRHRCVFECRLNTPVVTRHEFSVFLKTLSSELGMKSHPELPEPVITSASGHSLDKHSGLEAMLFWLESGLHAYWWEKFQLLTLDMHSCAFLDAQIVEQVTGEFFDVVEICYLDLTPENIKTDNPKVEVRRHDQFGQGVFAKEDLAQGEFIAGFYGEVYEVENALAIPTVAVNHAIQFSENKWRDSLTDGAARHLNHSCNPNCGLSGLFDLVAMRDINAGEELRWDYAMTDDSNWEVPGGRCLCGTPSCRGRIVPYRELTAEEQQEYLNYTSAWLIRKYRQLRTGGN